MRRTALVTGAARGSGRAIALDLARDHDVAVSWRTAPPEGLPPSVLAIHADLTAPGAAEALGGAATARFGRLDVLINNAGLFAPSPPEGFDAGAATAMLGVNLLAPQALLAAALPHLRPGAAVVSLSSVNAALPPRGGALFGASLAVPIEGFATLFFAGLVYTGLFGLLALVFAFRGDRDIDVKPVLSRIPGLSALAR